MTPPIRAAAPLRRALATALAAFAGLAPAAPAAAAEIEGVRFADRVLVQGTELSLLNVGLMRYRVFFKVYVAALYLAPGTSAADVLADVPKRLEIHYFYGFRAEEFRASTDSGTAKNVDAETLQRLRPGIERLNALYEDVEPGDRYSLTYLPGAGTELAKNGRVLGSVGGADLAAAVFGIWLGQEPFDRSLKEQLLAPR